MALRLPSEIVVEQVLPTLRVRLARAMVERGFTQRETATRLGVTQAAVSGYVNGEAPVEQRIDRHPRTRETVARIADGFEAGEMDGSDALAELLALIRSFEDRGPICELHEEAMPALQGLGCDLCIQGGDERLAAEREALANVRTAARRLASTPGMADYVPNVGTNLGCALPDATESTGVAAIPGRLYAMNGRVEIPANPEFGASRHVATVVLAAMAETPEMRGALDLATDDAVLRAARERGIEPLKFDADYEDRGDRLRERFRANGGVPRVVYHRGAFGIEPITYVLGATADDAARLAAELVEAVRQGSRE